MTDTNPSLPPLTLPAQSFADDVSAFDGDLLLRSVLAGQIEQLLPRLRNGAVIAVDSQWGGGKTWFGMNWAKSLRASGHKVAFINAFEQDYTEDPFLPIAAELTALLDGDSNKALLKKAAEVATACLPVAAKVATSALSKWALGEVDLAEEYEAAVKKAEEKSEEFVKRWVERKLENHKKEQESLKGFRKALSDMATKESRPVIVFVDELDRCRPDFAVRLIERIKHFFETPNVIFVLLIHREQLNRAIAGVYGQATDGAAYLSKFVHFFFTLPSINTRYYIPSVLDRLGFDGNNRVASRFAQAFALWQTTVGLTMRDIERGCALFSYARVRDAEDLLAYLITLKMKRPDLFDGMLANNHHAFREAREWTSQARFAQNSNENVKDASDFFNTLDLMYGTKLGEQSLRVTSDPNVSPRLDFRYLGSNVHARSVEDAFKIYLRQIDLPIE
ncbi:KAP family P-loop NTPase fold protein [Burkholderia vietnamiensis]|uniref:KAP family P-loop NTPase fold protein n=1 Tax=Burkholderia vietnamiensis TaxID=60552 RepID=UPI001CB295DF|nr:P-loop NTPase fold protein [Burkholderia vietnamiensis]CAG9228634.1 KAP NTPase domain-containing protein [Burkholderia vietnamiensis]